MRAALPARRATTRPLRVARASPHATPPRAVRKTYGSFDEMIKESDVPVLVDFYAPWCGPCQLMHTTVSAVAADLGEDVKFVRINTDAHKDLASRFAVRALPTLILFRDGAPVDRLEGAVPVSTLAERLRYYSRGLDKKFGSRQ